MRLISHHHRAPQVNDAIHQHAYLQAHYLAL
jgi:hypothetical protein